VTSTPSPSTSQLVHAHSMVAIVIEGVRDDQWSAPSPCSEWSVRDLVNHVVGMNLVFSALLTDEPAPQRVADRIGADPVGVYRTSASALVAAFDQPGVLERTYQGLLGAATGRDRLQIRLYDLVAHGWDLAQATGQCIEFPSEMVEQALAFAEVQLAAQARTGRFDPPVAISPDAPALDRLVAFLGRSPGSA